MQHLAQLLNAPAAHVSKRARVVNPRCSTAPAKNQQQQALVMWLERMHKAHTAGHPGISLRDEATWHMLCSNYGVNSNAAGRTGSFAMHDTGMQDEAQKELAHLQCRTTARAHTVSTCPHVAKLTGCCAMQAAISSPANSVHMCTKTFAMQPVADATLAADHEVLLCQHLPKPSACADQGQQ
jgi:hypothetical protein